MKSQAYPVEGFDYCHSPIGLLELVSFQGRLVTCRFVQEENLPAACPDTVTSLAVQQLNEYFNSKRQSFDLPFHYGGTAFKQAVVQELLNIPFGETRTYNELARSVHSPSGSRAAGSVISRNPLLIIIPCHRVVGQNGSLTGYAGGLERKRWLIGHEMNTAIVPGRLF